MRSGIWRLDAGGAKAERLASNPEDTAWSRFNDGRTDPAGRFLAGTMDEPKAGARGHLYRFDRRGLTPLVDGVTTSNGLAFSPDGRTMYHADTPRFTVWAYDYDTATGTAENRRAFVTLDPAASDRARPDGAAVDADGCYWIALYEGGRIHRYDPAGALMAAYPVPARCPTMPAFGGPDLRTLFVTTARAGRPDDELAALTHSGSLFAMPVDVAGLPSPDFDPSV
jgi:sugar lactone lactonase YvrE